MLYAMPWIACALLNLPIKQRLEALPKHLKVLIAQVVKDLHPSEVLLFGSRARGDARDLSDFDLAVLIDTDSNHASENWIRFRNWLEETPPSLFHYDVLDFNTASNELQSQITSEGVSLYRHL